MLFCRCLYVVYLLCCVVLSVVVFGWGIGWLGLLEF